ncbi:MAG: hypothetical protein EXS16_04275 [Gemmataceae bacterium]|nr:hypothetical protein [Gemmataceae bacterium]
MDNATIELRNGASWVRLSIRLAEDFTGGSVVRLGEATAAALEAGDAISSSYTKKNWLSGIASGAFYAFRTLKIQRRVVVATELTGRLSSPDIQVLAYATARLIAEISHRELPLEELDGWKMPASETPAGQGISHSLPSLMASEPAIAQ